MSNYLYLIEIKEFWNNYFIISLIGYLPTIFLLNYFRSYFNFKNFLTIPYLIWNLSLSIFSLIGTYYTLFYILKFDFKNNMFEEEVGRWYIYFLISKIFELGDTLFIIFMDKKLQNIHWFHHILTLYICYHAMNFFCNEFIVFIFMNYFVHTFMYFYYFIYSFYPQISKYGKYITYLQILQMIFGLIFVIYNYNSSNLNCPFEVSVNLWTYVITGIMYFIYLILFLQVYFNREKRIKNDFKKN